MPVKFATVSGLIDYDASTTSRMATFDAQIHRDDWEIDNERVQYLRPR